MGVSERTRSVTLQELMSPWLLSLRAPLTAKGCAVEDAPQAPDFIENVLLLAEPYVMQEHSSRGTTGIYSVCKQLLCAVGHRPFWSAAPANSFLTYLHLIPKRGSDLHLTGRHLVSRTVRASSDLLLLWARTAQLLFGGDDIYGDLRPSSCLL